MNPIYAALPTTIFEIMSSLAREHGAVNLGQGFPEADGPIALRQAAAQALLDFSNQYPPMRGLPELRSAIADHYGRAHGVALEATAETLVTSGATEAIAAALLAVLSPGDEAILFTPAYDCYAPMIRRAGANPRFVRLNPPDWRIDGPAFNAAQDERTRAIIVNTPHNPAASLLHPDDLDLIAEIAAQRDLIVISDEVWEHVTFDGATHRTLLAHPLLRERCIKIGSAGKMFSMTGWKVGFVCATASLADATAKAHQFLTFTTPPNLQRAAALGLAYGEDYFQFMRNDLQRSRDRLTAGLTAAGFSCLPSAGTYFLNLDLAASGIDASDVEFSFRAVREAKVAVIPLSAFYESDAPTHLVRLCFAKSDETLDRGVEALSRARQLFTRSGARTDR